MGEKLKKWSPDPAQIDPYLENEATDFSPNYLNCSPKLDLQFDI